MNHNIITENKEPFILKDSQHITSFCEFKWEVKKALILNQLHRSPWKIVLSNLIPRISLVRVYSTKQVPGEKKLLTPTWKFTVEPDDYGPPTVKGTNDVWNLQLDWSKVLRKDWVWSLCTTHVRLSPESLKHYFAISKGISGKILVTYNKTLVLLVLILAAFTVRYMSY